MMRYPALIDGKAGAYGLVFPDLDGVVAMGATLDDLLVNAQDSLRSHARSCAELGVQMATPSPLEDIRPADGETLTSVPFIRLSGRPARANMTMDEGTLAFIDGEAARRKMTRSAYVDWMARRIAELGD